MRNINVSLRNHELIDKFNQHDGDGSGNWTNYIFQDKGTIWEVGIFSKAHPTSSLSNKTQIRWVFRRSNEKVEFLGCFKMDIIPAETLLEKPLIYKAIWKWDGRQEYELNS